jgi:hypothetical protein
MEQIENLDASNGSLLQGLLWGKICSSTSEAFNRKSNVEQKNVAVIFPSVCRCIAFHLLARSMLIGRIRLDLTSVMHAARKSWMSD